MMKYVNPKRKQGSQQETPKLIVKENQLYVSGYQQFILTRSINNNSKNVSVNIQPSVYRGKFSFLAQACSKLAGLGNMKTLMDLGCSNGLLCFLALANGLETVWGLDHDAECLRLINRAVQILNIPSNQLETRPYKFGDSIANVLLDITTACALIHWVYSCTASFGSLSSIIEYLSQITGKVLIVEWVDPADKAIQSFHHLSFNRQIAREPYTRQNFEKALQTWFTGGFRKIYAVNSTRQLYIAVKPGFESILSLFTSTKSPPPIQTIKNHVVKHKVKAQRTRTMAKRSKLIQNAMKKFTS